ncbi:hypothetical protein V496_10428 [Pseudogymnoascus sp. VKM F-4515 (FW-2607)]|nr:hypothetical protein V496_10428 [Pseudogymnoascus sp. VKM F-4515 (FW-2607)]KFY78805.1 hypothetical protein V498_09045 [Pseudogymnoascus sp. VKM F-4517 (FW-2822)]
MRTPPPNTPKESSEPVATSTMKMGSSQPPDGVAHPARPDQGAPALGQERRVTSSEAVSYVKQIQLEFVDQPDIYSTFLHILKDYESKVIGFPGIVTRISELFAGHPNLIQGLNRFLPPRYQTESDSSNGPNAICATGHPATGNELTLISHINPPKMPGTPPNTPTESSDPVAPSTVHEIGASTSMLSEQLGIRTKMGPLQPDAAKDAEPFDLSTMMDQWSMSLPLPQMLDIVIQPPELTRQGIELFPPIVVRLLQPEDMPDVWAIATLLSNGTDVTDQLGGELFQSPIDEIFCFSGLAIYGQGVFCLRICLYKMDFDSCPKGVTQVGCVDSNDIIIAPRPDFIAICRSFGDATTAQDSRWVAQPLLYQTMDANTCIDDYTGYFPNLKVHVSSSIITMGQIEQIEYSKYMVLKPVSDFMLETANMEHGLYNFENGLFRHEGGVWFDDGEIERAEGLDESVLLGDDGELYRKRTHGVFNGLYVGLERRATTVGNGDNSIMFIAHNVLIN